MNTSVDLKFFPDAPLETEKRVSFYVYIINPGLFGFPNYNIATLLSQEIFRGTLISRFLRITVLQGN